MSGVAEQVQCDVEEDGAGLGEVDAAGRSDSKGDLLFCCTNDQDRPKTPRNHCGTK